MKRGDTIFYNNPASSLHGEPMEIDDVNQQLPNPYHITCPRWRQFFGWFRATELSETPPTEPGKYGNLIDDIKSGKGI